MDIYFCMLNYDKWNHCFDVHDSGKEDFLYIITFMI